MSCQCYEQDIELLPLLPKHLPRYKNLFSHLKNCPECTYRYEVSQKLEQYLSESFSLCDSSGVLSDEFITHIRYLSCNELKTTILDAIKNNGTHPTLEQIYQEISPLFPEVGIKTVDHHICCLKRENCILELDFNEGFKRLDGNIKSHSHFFCSKCSAVYDICIQLKRLVYTYEINKLRHKILDCRLIFLGICKNCRLDKPHLLGQS